MGLQPHWELGPITSQPYELTSPPSFSHHQHRLLPAPAHTIDADIMGILTCLGLRRRNQWEPPTLLDHLLSSPLTFLTICFYRVVLLLRGHPFHPPPNKPAVRVVCISDTHDQFVHVPPGDILIHAGDLTNAGTAADIQRQLDWLKSHPHPVKIVVAGNHDSWFDVRSRPQEDKASGARVDLSGLLYLESGLTVQEVRGRKVTIFGVPDIPQCGPESFA